MRWLATLTLLETFTASTCIQSVDHLSCFPSQLKHFLFNTSGHVQSQVSTLQRQVTTAGFSSLAQQLLDEKNEQIDQLKEQLAQQNHYNSSDDAYSERNCLVSRLMMFLIYYLLNIFFFRCDISLDVLA